MNKFNFVKKGESGKLDGQIDVLLNSLADNAKDSVEVPWSQIQPMDVRLAPDALKPFNPSVDGELSIHELDISGDDGRAITLRIYKPAGVTDAPVLIFLHGGCWVFCDLDTHDGICRVISDMGRCLVVSVAYALAPEHPFPAGLDDAYSASCWVAQNIANYGGNPNKLAVCGDSAGGNLAAGLSILCKQNGGPSFCCQWLMYPITNPSSTDTKSHQKYSKGYFFESETYLWAREHYLGSSNEIESALVSPLLAKNLGSLPAALIQTAEFDILRDEGEAYARALYEQNVDVQLIRYQGAVHAFIAMAGAVDAGMQALRDGVSFLNKHWNNNDQLGGNNG